MDDPAPRRKAAQKRRRSVLLRRMNLRPGKLSTKARFRPRCVRFHDQAKRRKVRSSHSGHPGAAFHSDASVVGQDAPGDAQHKQPCRHIEIDNRIGRTEPGVRSYRSSCRRSPRREGQRYARPRRRMPSLTPQSSPGANRSGPSGRLASRSGPQDFAPEWTCRFQVVP
jgi:hypothetical protein